VRLPAGFSDATEALACLPGVGERTATRFGFFLLERPEATQAIAEALTTMHQRVGTCVQCYNIADADVSDGLCELCANPSRFDARTLCVVETVPHLLAIERTDIFKGTYHVLHGVLSPIKGIGPNDLHLPQLIDRVQRENISEVIVATDADVEGEATAAYIREILLPLGSSVTRIATGVPMGSDLEYLDGTTVARALMGRKPQTD